MTKKTNGTPNRFQIIKASGRANAGPAVTLRKHGVLAINAAALTKLGATPPTHVFLGWDSKAQEAAIMPATEADAGAIRLHGKGSGRTASSKGFLNVIGCAIPSEPRTLTIVDHPEFLVVEMTD